MKDNSKFWAIIRKYFGDETRENFLVDLEFTLSQLVCADCAMKTLEKQVKIYQSLLIRHDIVKQHLREQEKIKNEVQV
jgi:hypothetical protein